VDDTGRGRPRLHPLPAAYSLPISLSIQDVRYLKPHVENVVAEVKEREVWDTMAVSRK
jgi:hypothetical protein